MLKAVNILILSLVLLACQGMEFASHVTNLDSPVVTGFDGTETFKQSFTSDKLDLVFVLDTPAQSDSVISEIFTSEFVQELQDYNWKLAYTQTGLSEELVQSSKQEKECGFSDFVGGMLSGVAGVFIENPMLAINGASSMITCLPTSKQASVDARFLPFEKRGKKLSSFLTKDSPEALQTFDHTFKKGTIRGFRSFDAPVIQKEESYPVTASMLSLHKNKEFFRQDSSVIYVILSFREAKEQARLQDLYNEFDNLFAEESKSRFHAIPINLQPETKETCQRHLINKGLKNGDITDSLQEISDYNVKGLDICSPNLKQDLLKQIGQFVHPSHLFEDID